MMSWIRISPKRLVSSSIVFLFVSTVLVLSFQNCSQPGNIDLKTPQPDVINQTQGREGPDGDPTEGPEGTVITEPPPGQGTTTIETVSYKTLVLDLNKKQTPPLKMFLIVDNSESMRLSQLNLKKSISAMFDKQSQNISSFDVEIFFISTNQLPSLVPNSVFDQMLTPENFASTQNASALSGQYRTPASVNGLIYGDSLGFVRVPLTSGLRSSFYYLPQPVNEFQETNTGLRALPSIKFNKGDSIDVITRGVSARLDVLDPAKTAESYPLFNSLDTESGLCALSRVLKTPEGLLNVGDLASFIIVSDENESDLEGKKCVHAEHRDPTFNLTCKKVIPESTQQLTVIRHRVPAGADQIQTSFGITPKDLVVPKVLTSLRVQRTGLGSTCRGQFQNSFIVVHTLSVPQYKISYTRTPTGPNQTLVTPEVPATCSGNYQSQFMATGEISSPRYKITYTEEAYISTREGGTVVFGKPNTKETSAMNGDAPSSCDRNLLLSKTGGSTSHRYSNITCVPLQRVSSTSTATLSFSNFTTEILGSNCSDSVKNQLLNGKLSGSRVESCSTAGVTISLPSQVLGAIALQEDRAGCEAKINAVCAKSGGALRSCSVKSHTSYAAAVYKTNTYTPVNEARQVSGLVPTTCDLNLVRLVTKDNSSNFSNISCLQGSPSVTPSAEKELAYADFSMVDLNQSTACPPEVRSNLVNGKIPGTQVASCQLKTKILEIFPSLLTAFPPAGTRAQCESAILGVCSSKPLAHRSCTLSVYKDPVASYLKDSADVLADKALDCKVACGNYPGFCEGVASTLSVGEWATSLGASCSVKRTINSTTEFNTVAQANRSLSTVQPQALSCESLCSQFPGACGGQSSNQTILSFNKLCAVTGTRTVPGSAGAWTDLGAVVDQNQNLSCSTPCSQSLGLCGADQSARTIEQYIRQTRLAGAECTHAVQTQVVPGKTLLSSVAGVVESAISTSCPVDYFPDLTTRVPTGSSQKTVEYVSGVDEKSLKNLSDFIYERAQGLVGLDRMNLSVFVTPKDQVTPGVTTWGADYEVLAQRTGGNVQNIRDESYAPALRNLSSILRDQLDRSIQAQGLSNVISIRRVWKRGKGTSDWGDALPVGVWSSAGNTITLGTEVELDPNDEIMIEYKE